MLNTRCRVGSFILRKVCVNLKSKEGRLLERIERKSLHFFERLAAATSLALRFQRYSFLQFSSLLVVNKYSKKSINQIFLKENYRKRKKLSLLFFFQSIIQKNKSPAIASPLPPTDLATGEYAIRNPKRHHLRSQIRYCMIRKGHEPFA